MFFLGLPPLLTETVSFNCPTPPLLLLLLRFPVQSHLHMPHPLTLEYLPINLIMADTLGKSSSICGQSAKQEGLNLPVILLPPLPLLPRDPGTSPRFVPVPVFAQPLPHSWHVTARALAPIFLVGHTPIEGNWQGF